jgi:hypothetical protein
MSTRAAVLFALLLVALAACASWGRRMASAELDDDETSRGRLRLFVTGNTGGFLAPCGCESGQYGGLARRATYLRRVARGDDDLVLDLGNLVTSESFAKRHLLRASLEGLKTIGCDALVPGEGEVRLGQAFADECAAAKGPVICANLVRAADGAPVFPGFVERPLANGKVVVVVGVTEPFADVPSEWRVTSPEDAVRDVVARCRGRADAFVVAASVGDDAALALAERLSEVALVVGGRSEKGSDGLVSTRGAPAMLVGEFGAFVGRVAFDERLRVADAHRAWLDEDVPDDPDAASLVARYKAGISQEGGDFATRILATLREQRFAGSASCAECHAAETATWRASGHAHAMRTLVEKASQRNPECVGCHLVDVTPPPTDVDALGVGCEACHGGASRHVDLARSGAPSAKALAPATRAACLRCHSPPNDTHFEFDAKWPKIAHGRAH